MNHAIPNLQIQIHKVDGSIKTLIQHDATRVQELLDGFQPAEIFNRKRFVFSDANSITSLPVSKITRIDLISEQLPHLIFPVGIVDAVELTETQFQALVRNPVMREQLEQMSVEGASVVTFMDMQMADGQRLLLTMETHTALLQPEWLNTNGFVFSGSGLCFRMRTGGVSVLNLAHLVRLSLFPKPPHPPVAAWHTEAFQKISPPIQNQSHWLLTERITSYATTG